MLLYAQTPSLQFTSTVSKSTYKHYKSIVWIVKKKKPKELAIIQKMFWTYDLWYMYVPR